MPIKNRNLKPGTKLVAKYKKETYHGFVSTGENGKVLYQLTPSDGKEYKSPSSLGTAVTGKACNGWSFWSVDAEAESEPDPATEQEANPQPPAAPETEPEPEDTIEEDAVEAVYSPLEEDADPPQKPASFRRVPNQRGVDPGQERLYCDTCHNSFIVPEDKNPETCPMGHEPV